jgi:hypothetical protein
MESAVSVAAETDLAAYLIAVVLEIYVLPEMRW